MTGQVRFTMNELQKVLLISRQNNVSSAILKRNLQVAGYQFRNVTPGDGNCFFHAIVDQLHRVNDDIEDNYEKLRQQVVAHLDGTRHQNDGTDRFSFVEGYQSWEDYIQKMKKDGTWVDHLVVMATAEYLGRDIWVYASSPDGEKCGKNFHKIRSPRCLRKNPLLVAHYHESHYQSIEKQGTKHKLSDDETEGPKPKVLKGQVKSKMDELKKVLLISKHNDVSTTILKRNLQEAGYQFRGVTPGDGNCFFHAIVDQLDCVKDDIEVNYAQLRQQVVAHLDGTRHQNDGTDRFSFVESYQSWEDYIQMMKKDGTWVDHLVVMATAEYLGREIWVYTSSPDGEKWGKNFHKIRSPRCCRCKPLLVAHYHESHYQSIEEQGSDTKSSMVKKIVGMQDGEAKTVIVAQNLYGGAGNTVYSQDNLDVSELKKDLEEPSIQIDDELQKALETSRNCNVSRNKLKRKISQRGYEFRGTTPDDGNSFFHAIIDQLEREKGEMERDTMYDTEESTDSDTDDEDDDDSESRKLRRRVVEHLNEQIQHIPPQESDDILRSHGLQSLNEYIQKMRDEETPVDHLVIKVTAKVLDREIWMFTNAPKGQETGLIKVNTVDDAAITPLLIAHYKDMRFQSLNQSALDVADKDPGDPDPEITDMLKDEEFRRFLQVKVNELNLCTLYLDQEKFNTQEEAERKQYRKNQLERLIHRVSSLRNSRRGALVVCVKKKHEHDLKWFLEWADNSLRSLIDDGTTTFDKAYCINYDSHLKFLKSNEELVILSVLGSNTSFSTAKFNSTEATNHDIPEITHRRMEAHISGRKKFKNKHGNKDIFHRLQTCKYRETPNIKFEKGEQHSDITSLLESILGDDRLPKYISAFNKIQKGGSVLYGVDQSKTNEDCLAGIQLLDNDPDGTRMKRDIMRRLKTSIGFFDYDGQSVDENDVCDIVLHQLMDIKGEPRYIIEVSAMHYPGISFYKKEGPDCFEIRSGINTDRNKPVRLINNYTRVNVQKWVKPFSLSDHKVVQP